ncbi:MAG: tail fiber domain-containing protein [Rhodobacteraceae bacterium]|nr:tail fiber domain-containing protein [Paracoccaceae bacterium]
MGKQKAPPPPDPRETSAAATSTNVGTAVSNAFLGNVNQVTPEGTLSYDQTGSHDWYDPYTGQTYNIPRFTATQTYSPGQQAIRDQSESAELNLATLASDQSSFLQDYMAQPIDLSSENVQNYINTHYYDDFSSDWEKQRSDLDSRLANQGIKLGSEAYDRAFSEYSQSRADARDNLYGNMYGLAQGTIAAERNQPINEITALLSGSQVNQPNFVNANMPRIPTTDVGGLINQNYNQQLAQWQQQQNQRQGMLGGLFGLGAGMLSDKRAKKDIKKVGELKGHKLYEYEYKDADNGLGKQIGVMAQEVEKKRPDAVSVRPDGHKQVHYGRLFGMGDAR